jgi:predicted phage terminase large subunit-like protein
MAVGGSLTGRGARIMIVDDPSKAMDANSPAALESANDWFTNTALSRLDDRANGLIIVVAQRLHANDLSGALIERGSPSLVLPMLATESADYEIDQGMFHHRCVGDLLQPQRDRLEDIDELKTAVGSKVFQTQYQQDPVPPDGNTFKIAWIKRYTVLPLQNQPLEIMLSWDTASKVDDAHDYSVGTAWATINNQCYLLDVVRGPWEFPALLRKMIEFAATHKATTILIEDANSGTAVIQSLRQESKLNVIGIKPKLDKRTRAEQQSTAFEAGRVYLPVAAHWLAVFETELLGFPYAKHDDQIDSAVQFLQWVAERTRHQISFHEPYVVSRPRNIPGSDNRGGIYW